MSRDAFEEMLGAMAWTRLVRLSDATFEKNGTQISSRKVSLMRAALSVGFDLGLPEQRFREVFAQARRRGLAFTA